MYLTNKLSYTYSVDLWSIGIMLYELIVGYFPFGNDVDDPYESSISFKIYIIKLINEKYNLKSLWRHYKERTIISCICERLEM